MLWAFTKYHALGNDYIVIDPKNLPSPLTPAQVKTICHRNYGIGSDGILLGPLPSKKAAVRDSASSIPTAARPKKAATACGFFRVTCGTRNWSARTSSPSKPPAAW